VRAPAVGDDPLALRRRPMAADRFAGRGLSLCGGGGTEAPPPIHLVSPYVQRACTVKTWSAASSEAPLARQPTGFPFSISGLL
jgi:hypothetical protein